MLQPHLLLQEQIKGRFLPTSLNNRSEIALTFSAMDQQNRRPVILKYYQQNEHREIQDQIQRGVMQHAQLRSDYIVPLIDFGVHGQYGGVWCVLSREEAPNLTRFVKAKDGLDAQTTCEILIGLCEALAPLHAEAKIHGNIKPNNIFVKERSNLGLQVLISDILGANLCGVHKANGQRVTYNDPSFFTYEQASGKTIDQQTDLGALGLLAYFMINARLPFQGRTNDKILTSVIISSGRVKVKKDEIKGGPEQKTKLAKLINQCLAKQSSSRPKSLEFFKASLQEIQKLGSGSSAIPNSSLDALGQVGDSGFSMPNLTPNHSLMNPLGFGQTLGFDAITEQTLNQYQAAQNQAPSTTPLPASTPSQTPPPLPAQATGSHKAIITAPPEGFEAESFDSLESFDSSLASSSQISQSNSSRVEHTLMAAPHSLNSGSQTMMGGLSFDQLQELQGMQILNSSEPEEVETPQNEVSDTLNLAEDTRPLTRDELAQLGVREAESTDVPAQSGAQDEVWGDFNDWQGLAPEQSTAIEVMGLSSDHEQNLAKSDVQQSLGELNVDELELDMLLEQAASALASEIAPSNDPIQVGAEQANLSHEIDSNGPDTLSSATEDMHQLDWNQHSTLFNQALVIPQLEIGETKQAEHGLNQALPNTEQHSETLIQTMSDFEATAKINVAQDLESPIFNQSLSDRFEENSQGIGSQTVEITDAIAYQAIDSIDESGFEIPELFSSPASSITPERITDEFELTERLELPANLDDLGMDDDFAAKDARMSGLFPIPDGINQEQTYIETAPQKSRMGILEGNEQHSPIQELDTQLEFQRPEEIFPDVPEWRSLVDLKDKPRALSQALLSIPLPLSGQLLPFSQFQLEIEGKEHEEGFFVAGRPTHTHVPVVLEPEALDSLQESNMVWEAVEQSSASHSQSDIHSPPQQAQQSKAGLNLMILILVLLMMGIGLVQFSGMSLEDLSALVNGGQYDIQPQTTRSMQPSPPQKLTTIKSKEASSLNSELNVIIPESDDIEIEPTVDQPKKTSAIDTKGTKQNAVKASANTKSTNRSSKRTKTKRAKSQAKKAKTRSTKKKRRRKKKKSAIKDPFAN